MKFEISTTQWENSFSILMHNFVLKSHISSGKHFSECFDPILKFCSLLADGPITSKDHIFWSKGIKASINCRGQCFWIPTFSCPGYYSGDLQKTFFWSPRSEMAFLHPCWVCMYLEPNMSDFVIKLIVPFTI